MNPNVKELVELVIRWAHFIAGIMWIGNSMLFNWLDRNLEKKAGDPELRVGTMWMVHSGGFYEVEKKHLAPGEMPPILHWFKWQSYITWMTGVALLLLVYYATEGMLADPAVANLTPTEAMEVGLGSIFGGFALYEILWRTPIAKIGWLATALSFCILGGAVYGLTHLLSGRAAYIHVGAMIGTCMSGNVFFHIIPSQRELVRATLAGEKQNPAIGQFAKQRSIHNNYLTFPLLFLMISNHFPSTYGSPVNWVILAVLIVGGAGVRHFMNIRYDKSPVWIPGAIGTGAVAAGIVLALIMHPPGAKPVVVAANGPYVSFSQVNLVIGQRCRPCHSAKPSDPTIPVAPVGVMFDTPEQIQMRKERIQARAVVSKTMPQNNKTGITDDERNLLAQWLAEGAPIDK
ncbi:MAG: urate hydroxylase PuuD [Polyangiaceae bacterium]